MKRFGSIFMGTLLSTTALTCLPAWAQTAPAAGAPVEEIVVRGAYIPEPKRETSEISSFITPEDFEFRKPNMISQMAESHPAVHMQRNVSNPRKDIITGASCTIPSKSCIYVGQHLRCVMTVYLDRVRIVGKPGNVPDDYINELVVPSQVAAMEIYPRGVGAPPEYQPMNGSCGVVLIWSK